MRIGFIGAGKVGFTLGKYFAVNGLDVAGVSKLQLCQQRICCCRISQPQL